MRVTTEFSFELPDDTEVGTEITLRVRLTEVREELIEVTSLGDDQPRVLPGVKHGHAELLWRAFSP